MRRQGHEYALLRRLHETAKEHRQELAADGVHIGRKRVARLMRVAGVQGVSRRKPHRTTRRDPGAAPALDLVSRDVAGILRQH